MLCIAAFIVLVILGIFSGFYRNLAKKAWKCVLKRITFKPCDTDFSQEVKNKLLAKVILKYPLLAKFLDKWLDVLAFLFVGLTIVSLIWVLLGGVNLFVYDTCTPDTPESCSLGGEACSVNSGKINFWQAIGEGKIITWSKDEWFSITDTFKRIPDRFKKWQPEQYISTSNDYYRPYDVNKPIALEIIDPSCRFCAKLFGNIKTAGFENNFNLTFLDYPIPTPNGGYKFNHSYLIATYLEAVKVIKPAKTILDVPADWQILEKIFTGKDTNNAGYQDQFNTFYNATQAQATLNKFLLEIGYSQDQLEQVAKAAQSEQVKLSLASQKDIVENKIRTLKIPTIMFDGRRFDRVIGPNQLK